MARFSVGDKVFIVGGPADGHDATVSAVNDESATVVVQTVLFGREVPVEASFDQVRASGRS